MFNIFLSYWLLWDGMLLKNFNRLKRPFNIDIKHFSLLSIYSFIFKRWRPRLKTERSKDRKFEDQTGFKDMEILVKKTQAKIWKKKFQLSNLSQLVFLIEIPTDWGSDTAMCLIFLKSVLDIFALCSLVPRMNLSYTQQDYLMPKKSKLTSSEGRLKVFL